MRILFIFDRDIIPERGGIERVTALLADEMEKRGHNITYLSLSEKMEKGPEEARQVSIPLQSDNFRERLNGLLETRKIDTVIFQGANKTVVSVLDKVPSDFRKYLVLHIKPHVFHGNERAIMRLTPWNDLSGKRKLMKLMGLAFPPLLRKINLKRYNALYRHIMNHTDRLVLLSQHSVARILSLGGGMDPSRLVAINNPNTFEIPDTENAQDKENLVIFVARLSNPQKNVTGFIDVWRKFHKMRPDWKAVIIGDGEHRAMAEKYAERKRVGNLSFAGHQKFISDYYRWAKMICMTSTYEGWGMVLTEAMAYDCVPVVYDSYEAVHEIIHHNHNGMLVRPFREDEMAKAMKRIADDEALRKSMAAAGREKINDFRIERIVDRWEELLMGEK